MQVVDTVPIGVPGDLGLDPCRQVFREFFWHDSSYFGAITEVRANRVSGVARNIKLHAILLARRHDIAPTNHVRPRASRVSTMGIHLPPERTAFLTIELLITYKNIYVPIFLISTHKCSFIQILSNYPLTTHIIDHI
jgi:hypothetical protein